MYAVTFPLSLPTKCPDWIPDEMFSASCFLDFYPKRLTTGQITFPWIDCVNTWLLFHVAPHTPEYVWPLSVQIVRYGQNLGPKHWKSAIAQRKVSYYLCWCYLHYCAGSWKKVNSHACGFVYLYNRYKQKKWPTLQWISMVWNSELKQKPF